MKPAGMALVLLLLRQSDDPALELHRALEEKRNTSPDPEVRRRVADLGHFLKSRVGLTLTGEPVTPDETPLLRFHDPRTLTAYLVDRPFPAAWEFRLNTPPAPQVEAEPMESPIGEEQIVDLIKEKVAPGRWEKDQTIEKTPSGELLIHAPPSVHRAIARYLRVLEAEMKVEWRVAVEIFGFAHPVAVPATGVVEEADLKRAASRVGAFELSAPAMQRVSGFSGREAELLVGYDGDVPRRARVLDGLCAEVMVLPATEGCVQLRGRVAFRKLLGVDELTTAKGAIQSPRVAETSLSEESRRLPLGRPCVLGLLGPVAEEAKLPPYLLVVVRVDRRR